MDYPAKIILFGEYGIILNSKALAIPYPRFSGRFRFSVFPKDKRSQRITQSNATLFQLKNYFKRSKDKFQYLNLDHFNYDLQRGLYFDSTIPEGSGLGSSGALAAAVYGRYAKVKHPDNLTLIKQNLAAIESFFHGVSSGIDPFISWMKKPILIGSQNSINPVIDLSPFLSNYTLFLINSQSSGKTEVLVNQFLNQYQLPEFREKIDQEYIPLINQTIDAVIAGDFSTFETVMARYSQFQLTHLQPMIPSTMYHHFKYGIESDDFYLKICGSGGGGFITAIAHDRARAESYFNLNHLDYTVV